MHFEEDISQRWEDYYNMDSKELMFNYIIHRRTRVRLEQYLQNLILYKCEELGYEDVDVEFTNDRLFLTVFGEKLNENEVNIICEEFDLIFDCLTFECTTYEFNEENNYKQSFSDGNIEYHYAFEFKRYLMKDWLKRLKELDDKYLSKKKMIRGGMNFYGY